MVIVISMTQCDGIEDTDPSFCVRLRTHHVTSPRMAACFSLLLNLFVDADQNHNHHRYHSGHRHHNDDDHHHYYEGDGEKINMRFPIRAPLSIH